VRDATTGQLYGGSVAYRHENDLFWRLRRVMWVDPGVSS
jgi:hypothetical protein